MARLLGISGSLRAGSFNTALLRNAADLLPAGSTLEVATLHGVPLYDGDAEAKDGIPAAVAALKEKVMACDGLLLATPEYNGGIPGVFKNAIDWMSRPTADLGKVFGGRRVGLVGASAGGFGTVLAQDAWLSVLRKLGTQPWFGGTVMVSRAGQAFDGEGRLVDERSRKALSDYLEGFVRYVER